MILGQVQQRQKQEEDEQMESSIAQLTDKDPFNLSNDDYYMPKNTEKFVSFGVLFDVIRLLSLDSLLSTNKIEIWCDFLSFFEHLHLKNNEIFQDGECYLGWIFDTAFDTSTEYPSYFLPNTFESIQIETLSPSAFVKTNSANDGDWLRTYTDIDEIDQGKRNGMKLCCYKRAIQY